MTKASKYVVYSVIMLVIALLLQQLMSTTAFAQEPTPAASVERDYGDLPDHYVTTGENAPAHALITQGEQLTLGESITAEADGQPHPMATDDNDDGIFPMELERRSQTFRLTAFIAGDMPSSGAMLGLWIDWNHDGAFQEDEFQAYNMAVGENNLTAVVPLDYEEDALGIRARLFEVGSIPGGTLDWTDFEGVAINGEVEDYVFVSLEPSAVTTQTISAVSAPAVPLLISLFALTLLLAWVVTVAGQTRHRLHRS